MYESVKGVKSSHYFPRYLALSVGYFNEEIFILEIYLGQAEPPLEIFVP